MEWRIQLEEEGLQPIKLGTGKNQIKIDCLAFADDIAILTKDRHDANIAIERLQETAEKAGLQISYEKTEYMEWKGQQEKYLETRYGKINRVNQFRYLVEWIQPNELEKIALQSRADKMNRAYGITKNTNNKKRISIRAKIRYYNAVIKPEGLYATECLAVNTKQDMEEIEKRERRILRKILGPRKDEEGQWRLRTNKEIYKKRRLSTQRLGNDEQNFTGTFREWTHPELHTRFSPSSHSRK